VTLKQEGRQLPVLFRLKRERKSGVLAGEVPQALWCRFIALGFRPALPLARMTGLLVLCLYGVTPPS
jgi:hypothetical protein